MGPERTPERVRRAHTIGVILLVAVICAALLDGLLLGALSTRTVSGHMVPLCAWGGIAIAIASPIVGAIYGWSNQHKWDLDATP